MTFRLSLLSLGLAAWLSTTALAADVEILARGPVHEGYAEPSEREPTATPMVPKEPPKPIEELPPDQKPEGANVQWMPGYWGWDEDKKDFIWISGFWRNAPPGRTWVPGSWRKGADGWQWTGGFWADAKGGDKAQMNYLPPPPKPLDDAGATTPKPSDNHTYVPGTWVWRDRWVWQPGFWSEYRPGWVWVSAHYRWTPAGYIFMDGYWDYPLAERGILFAPAYIPPAVYVQPAFVYTPTVVVREECLFGAFFCRRGFGCYYFGDYFAPTYASIGFVSWCGHVSASISIGGWCDPLFSYYSCGFRNDPFWRGGCVDLYVGRFRGDFMRPPTTLVQQNTVINNITNINNSKNINLNNVTMVSSLNDVKATGRRNLQSVSDAERQSQAQAARGVREIADKRATAETQLASTAKPGTQTTPRSLNLDVPKQPTASRTGTAAKGIDSKPATLPTGPKPSAVGNVDPRSTGNLHGKTDPLPTIEPGAKGITKPTIGAKADPTPRIDTQGPVLTPRPTLDLPKPSTNVPAAPKPATLSPPKSAAPAPKSSPPPKSTKPLAAANPISSPRRINPSAASLQSFNRPAPSFARAAAPAAMSRPAPRPAMAAYSRPAATVRQPAHAPSRPSAPAKHKK
jgi:hypothetical protein